MNISLEQVDQVIERTGCTYLQAKDLLVQTDGDVLEAIILWEKVDDVMLFTGLSYFEAKEKLQEKEWDEEVVIQENLENSKFAKTAQDFANTTKDFSSDLVKNLKELIRKGNVTRVILKRDEKVLLDIPVVAGALGAVIFTTATAVSIVVALISGCSLQLIKEDGEVFDVNKATLENFEALKAKVMNMTAKKHVNPEDDCHCVCHEEGHFSEECVDEDCHCLCHDDEDCDCVCHEEGHFSDECHDEDCHCVCHE